MTAAEMTSTVRLLWVPPMRLIVRVTLPDPSKMEIVGALKTKLPKVAMSLLMIVTRVEVWLPSNAPPLVGPDSDTSKVSLASEIVSKMIGMTIDLLVSPSANDRMPLVPT